MKNKKIAIVTGASRGIGAAIAKKLAKEGYLVWGVYEKNEEMAMEIQKVTQNIKMIKLNVSQENEVKKFSELVTNKWGYIDVLVNNAGISMGGNIEEFALEDWNKIINVNLTGKYLMCKYFIPLLRKQKGVIINMSSRGGLNEFVFSGFVAYSVSNAGINNLTLGLAKELKEDGIRVNAVIPTVTDTDRFKDSFTAEEQEEVRKAGKLGTAEEASDLIYSLVEDETRNGEILIDERVYIKTNA